MPWNDHRFKHQVWSPKNGSHLNDPWRTQHQNPFCCFLAYHVLQQNWSPFFSENVPSIRNQSTQRHFGCFFSHGKKLKDLTKLNNETGRSSRFPHDFLGRFIGRCLCSICAGPVQRKKKNWGTCETGGAGKNQKHYESTTQTLFCAKPLRLSIFYAFPSSCISQSFWAKKSPTRNWGAFSRVTRLAHRLTWWLIQPTNLILDSRVFQWVLKNWASYAKLQV